MSEPIEMPFKFDIGLTKREFFAGMALQGLLSSQAGMVGYLASSEKDVADTAVKLADALIEALKGEARG